MHLILLNRFRWLYTLSVNLLISNETKINIFLDLVLTYLQVDEKQLKTKDTVNKRLGVLGKEFIIDLQYLLNAKAAKSVDIFYFSDDNEFIVKFVVDKKEHFETHNQSRQIHQNSNSTDPNSRWVIYFQYL